MAKDEFGDEVEARTPAGDGLKELAAAKLTELRDVLQRIVREHREKGFGASAEAAADAIGWLNGGGLDRCLQDID